MVVTMTLNLAELPLKSTTSATLTPILTSEDGDTIALPALAVAGHARYFSILREHEDETSGLRPMQYSKHMEPFKYAATVPFESWMRNAKLSMVTDLTGCCSKYLGETEIPLLSINLEKPVMTASYAFITPAAEAVKVREIEGRAYVDFKLNKTNILPGFGHNPGELAKIRQSIDTIRDNSDTHIISLSITGYASPEGSYSNNERLAKGRTEALASYVGSLYDFPAGLIKTDWVPEDWDGLRKYLMENPALENATAILTIVDSDMAPDLKNDKIAKTYPATYRYLLENVYPSLRHSDYRVEYEVKSYTSPEEISEVFHSRPGNLSLQEFFVLARSLPEGSDEYYDVLETATRLFPESEEAAVNAAFASINRKDYSGALRHLEKAGDRPEAIYARGLTAAFNGELKEARELLTRAKGLGVAQAEAALQSLEAIEADN